MMKRSTRIAFIETKTIDYIDDGKKAHLNTLLDIVMLNTLIVIRQCLSRLLIISY